MCCFTNGIKTTFPSLNQIFTEHVESVYWECMYSTPFHLDEIILLSDTKDIHFGPVYGVLVKPLHKYSQTPFLYNMLFFVLY